VVLGGLQFQQVVVQTIEAFFPKATKRVEPGLQLLEWLTPQLINSPVGLRPDLHNVSLTQNLEELVFEGKEGRGMA
jgi:hypothetical protein